jgi:hypothetical protein
MPISGIDFMLPNSRCRKSTSARDGRQVTQDTTNCNCYLKDRVTKTPFPFAPSGIPPPRQVERPKGANIKNSHRRLVIHAAHVVGGDEVLRVKLGVSQIEYTLLVTGQTTLTAPQFLTIVDLLEDAQRRRESPPTVIAKPGSSKDHLN